MSVKMEQRSTACCLWEGQYWTAILSVSTVSQCTNLEMTDRTTVFAHKGCKQSKKAKSLSMAYPRKSPYRLLRLKLSALTANVEPIRQLDHSCMHAVKVYKWQAHG